MKNRIYFFCTPYSETMHEKHTHTYSTLAELSEKQKRFEFLMSIVVAALAIDSMGLSAW